MTPLEIIRRAHIRLVIERAKVRFENELHKHARQWIRNQRYIDDLKAVCGIRDE